MRKLVANITVDPRNEQEGGSEPPCSPATKVSVSQAEGGRYAKHAHESWPPSMYDATHKVAQNHLLAHFLRWPPSTYDATHLQFLHLGVVPRIKGPHLGVI